MSYSDFKFYKPTLWDKFKIEGIGLTFLILLFAGIWISEFRWRLIITSLILLLIAMLEVAVLYDKEKKAENDAVHAKGEDNEE